MTSDPQTEGSATVLLLPGLGDSGPAHWQSRWEHLHPQCVRVVQDDWQRPHVDRWCQRLEEAVRTARGPVLLAAHSLGCALVAHWWSRGTPERILGALLVAPADVESPEHTPPETRPFAPLPLSPLPFPATVVASRNDPYVPLERARLFAARWGAAFVDAGTRGHINAESGLGDWPEGWRLLVELQTNVVP